MIASGVVRVDQPAPRLGRWHELVRTEVPGVPALIFGGFTGAILFLILATFLIGSVLTLIVMLSDRTLEENVFLGVLAVWHFTVGLVVVRSKVKFRQMQLLATIVNVPVAMCLVRYREELGVLQYLIFGYLDAWLIFLLARWRPTYKLLAVLNEEVHYYLID